MTDPEKPFTDDELLAARVANAAEGATKALCAIGDAIQRAWTAGSASRAEEQASRQAAAAARDARIKAARAHLRRLDIGATS